MFNRASRSSGYAASQDDSASVASSPFPRKLVQDTPAGGYTSHGSRGTLQGGLSRSRLSCQTPIQSTGKRWNEAMGQFIEPPSNSVAERALEKYCEQQIMGMQKFKDGEAVEYMSSSVNRWVPAKVVSFSKGLYTLDCKPDVPPEKLRRPGRSGMRSVGEMITRSIEDKEKSVLAREEAREKARRKQEQKKMEAIAADRIAAEKRAADPRIAELRDALSNSDRVSLRPGNYFFEDPSVVNEVYAAQQVKFSQRMVLKAASRTASVLETTPVKSEGVVPYGKLMESPPEDRMLDVSLPQQLKQTSVPDLQDSPPPAIEKPETIPMSMKAPEVEAPFSPSFSLSPQPKNTPLPAPADTPPPLKATIPTPMPTEVEEVPAPRKSSEEKQETDTLTSFAASSAIFARYNSTGGMAWSFEDYQRFQRDSKDSDFELESQGEFTEMLKVIEASKTGFDAKAFRNLLGVSKKDARKILALLPDESVAANENKAEPPIPLLEAASDKGVDADKTSSKEKTQSLSSSALASKAPAPIPPLPPNQNTEAPPTALQSLPPVQPLADLLASGKSMPPPPPPSSENSKVALPKKAASVQSLADLAASGKPLPPPPVPQNHGDQKALLDLLKVDSPTVPPPNQQLAEAVEDRKSDPQPAAPSASGKQQIPPPPSLPVAKPHIEKPAPEGSSLVPSPPNPQPSKQKPSPPPPNDAQLQTPPSASAGTLGKPQLPPGLLNGKTQLDSGSRSAPPPPPPNQMITKAPSLPIPPDTSQLLGSLIDNTASLLAPKPPVQSLGDIADSGKPLPPPPPPPPPKLGNGNAPLTANTASLLAPKPPVQSLGDIADSGKPLPPPPPPPPAKLANGNAPLTANTASLLAPKPPVQSIGDIADSGKPLPPPPPPKLGNGNASLTANTASLLAPKPPVQSLADMLDSGKSVPPPPPPNLAKVKAPFPPVQSPVDAPSPPSAPPNSGNVEAPSLMPPQEPKVAAPPVLEGDLGALASLMG